MTSTTGFLPVHRVAQRRTASRTATRAFTAGGEEDQVREAVRLAVRRCATLWTGKKPVVEVMLLQVAQ